MKLLFTVAPDAFYPPPRVESAVVSMTPFRPLPYPAKDELSLELVVASAFGKRRKTLRNALAAQLCEDDWARLGINPGLRAENLSVEDYVRMADFLRQRAPRHAAQV
jgi:16S rRNA (adenine1518-N6/adenine1519-N6)-dimethyltransferase